MSNETTASRDLRALVDAGLLEPRGERRGRLDVAGQSLREVWQNVRSLRTADLQARPDADAQQRPPGR